MRLAFSAPNFLTRAQFRGVLATVLALPLIGGGNADPGPTPTVLNQHTGIGEFQCGKNLAFAETGRLQTSSRLGKNCQKVLRINCLVFREAYERIMDKGLRPHCIHCERNNKRFRLLSQQTRARCNPQITFQLTRNPLSSNKSLCACAEKERTHQHPNPARFALSRSAKRRVHPCLGHCWTDNDCSLGSRERCTTRGASLCCPAGPVSEPGIEGLARPATSGIGHFCFPARSVAWHLI